MFCYCGNSPVAYVDILGLEKEYFRTTIGGFGGTATGLGIGLFVLVNQLVDDTADLYAQTKEDVKKLSQSLVDAAKKRWDDLQPCIHHVVPQGCTCEAAILARGVIGKNNVQSLENLVVIDYGTHRSIHSNGHMYCNLVNNALQTYGRDFGMVLTKVYIAFESAINGGYFYG